MPAWREVRLLVARELGERVYGGEPLVPARQSGMTWAARAQRAGPVVVKARHGDRAEEGTRWCATHLPALGARGYPVPGILWQGMISSAWRLTVQNRLPGRPLYPLDGPLDGPMLDALLHMVELQAGAGIPDEGRDFTGYLANVLFDDWDEIWADAARACAAPGPLCARLRRWLQPVWGLRCLLSYRIIGGLAVFTHERQAYGNSLGDEECAAESAILDRLLSAGRACHPR